MFVAPKPQPAETIDTIARSARVPRSASGPIAATASPAATATTASP